MTEGSSPSARGAYGTRRAYEGGDVNEGESHLIVRAAPWPAEPAQAPGRIGAYVGERGRGSQYLTLRPPSA